MNRRRITGIAIALWIVASLAGLAALERYASIPGAPGLPAQSWPTDSALNRAEDRPTLVMFLHPRCTCSQASLAELARLLAKAGDRLATHIVFTVPPGLRDLHDDQALWRKARTISAAKIFLDKNGSEARRFGSVTSGHVLLFDTDGRRSFAGGITPARGHEGDNLGARSILASVINAQSVVRDSTPVFGCPIRSSQWRHAMTGRQTAI